VPLFMFVLLFGISMDYHVFILSRIRERWTRGSSPREAIVGGVASGAGVVTSAALIMVAVFSIFLTLSRRFYRLLPLQLPGALTCRDTFCCPDSGGRSRVCPALTSRPRSDP
jgi:putative drug exporter of the RND superfamily